MNSFQTEAKAQFEEAETRLFEALNLRDVNLSDSEVASLRQRVTSAQARCRELGLLVETLHEAGVRMRGEAEARIKAFAEQQIQVIPILPRKMRMIASAVLGLIAVALCFDLSPGWALVLGGVVWLASYQGAAQLLPTPGIRVGRLAYRYGVTHIRHWPDKSDEHKDFIAAIRWEHAKGRQRWIRTR